MNNKRSRNRKERPCESIVIVSSSADAGGSGAGSGAGNGAGSGAGSGATIAKAGREDETSRPTSGGKSKWGRFMRNSSSSDAADADATSSTSFTASALKGSAESAKAAGNGNKIYPKLSRVPERQESVDDASARVVTVRPVIESTDHSPLHKSDVAATAAAAAAAAVKSATPATSMIDSFAELKHEVRDEVQRINHKMTRLEDILGPFSFEFQ